MRTMILAAMISMVGVEANAQTAALQQLYDLASAASKQACHLQADAIFESEVAATERDAARAARDACTNQTRILAGNIHYAAGESKLAEANGAKTRGDVLRDEGQRQWNAIQQAWNAGMFAALETPLRNCKDLFDRAIVEYQDAFFKFRDAAGWYRAAKQAYQNP